MTIGLPIGYSTFPVVAGYTPTTPMGGYHPTVPGAPTAVTALSGNASAVVSFSPPVNTGGSAITGYTAVSSPGGFTASGPSSPITVAGLTNGTAYTFTVTATNATGTSALSAPSAAITPSTIPGVPTIGVASPFNGYATVAFSANGNGGSAITGFTALSTPGAFTGSGTSSPITVNGLDSATNYTFQVSATNANGTSAYSAASNSIMPGPPNTVPGAPSNVVGFPDNAQVTLTFTAPSTGGSAITGYTATSVPGGITGTATASPIVVTTLTNGTAYTFTVTATNAVGTGPASAPSTAVTPSTVPGAPTSPVATRGNAQASVAFSAPASNGGAAITGYTVTASPGGITGTGTASPVVVTGLTNGTAYTFTVKATNARGTGAASVSSNSVTPATVPGAPTAPSASAGNAQASISFTAPASNGGSAITGYTVTSSPGSFTGTGTASPISVTGLTNGTAYTFTVKATNAIGTGAASSATTAVTPTSFVISTTSLPSGTVGTAYSATLAYSGGVPPITSANTSGGLPAGLTLVASTGTISGTPTAAGTTSSIFQGTDSSGTATSVTVADNEGAGASQTAGGIATTSSVALGSGPVVALTTVATYGGAHAPPGLQTTNSDTVTLQTSVAGPQSTAAGNPINASQETAMFTIASPATGVTTFQQWYGGAGFGGTNPGDQDYQAFKAYQYSAGATIIGIGAFTAQTGTAYAGVAQGTALVSGSITLTSAQVPCTLYGFCENTSNLEPNYLASPNSVSGISPTTIENTWGFGGGTPDNTSCYASWAITTAGTYTPSFNQNSTSLNCYQTVGWAVKAGAGSNATTPTKSLPITIASSGGGGSLYTGTISLKNGKFYNGANGTGSVIQLRGANMSALEFASVQTAFEGAGFPNDWGNVEPDWTAYAAWKPNCVRIPLNAGSWLGLTCTAVASNGTSWGTTANCDHFGTYQATVKTAVTNAHNAGCYVILVLHWSAPQVTIGGVTHTAAPLGQMSAPNTTTDTAFWSSISSTFADDPGVMFEVFNENWLDTKNSESAAYNLLLNGGTQTDFTQLNYVYSASITGTWGVLGYQSIMNTIRANATNVCLVGGLSYTQMLQNWITYKPTDSLNQIAASWHPYPNGNYPYLDGDIYGRIGTDPGGGTSSYNQWALALQTAGYAICITEDGGAGGVGATSSPGEPHMAYMQSQADTYGWSYNCWQWNNAQTVTTTLHGYVSGTTFTVTSGAGSIYLQICNIAGYAFQLNSGSNPTWTISGPSQTIGSAGSPVLFGQLTDNFMTAGSNSSPTPLLGEGSTTYTWMSGHTP